MRLPYTWRGGGGICMCVHVCLYSKERGGEQMLIITSSLWRTETDTLNSLKWHLKQTNLFSLQWLHVTTDRNSEYAFQVFNELDNNLIVLYLENKNIGICAHAGLPTSPCTFLFQIKCCTDHGDSALRALVCLCICLAIIQCLCLVCSMSHYPLNACWTHSSINWYSLMRTCSWCFMSMLMNLS